MGRRQPPESKRKRLAQPLGELAVIDRIRKLASRGKTPALQLGIGDDCAILRPRPNEDIVVTTDFSLERRHFRRDWHSPASVGHRTLARGLSDLAAMGARPLAAFLSLALPRTVASDSAWLDGFLEGLLALATEHAVPLAGGDTSESPSEHILADIVLVGSAPRGLALRRSGARPGDLLYCTGRLGGAAAELQQLSQLPRTLRSAQPAGNHPHLFPAPRLAAGQALLRRKLATACIDTSDGLSTDLAHLCEASDVSAELDGGQLPVHSLARLLGADAALEAALHGGEDYELLFTAPSTAKIPPRLGGVPVTRIGRVIPHGRNKPRITLLAGDSRRIPLEPHGWEHLK